MVTEYAGGGDLFSHLNDSGASSEAIIANFFRQILLALAHCHSLNITFGGIQAESLLLDDSKKLIKLAAYDTAR